MKNQYECKLFNISLAISSCLIFLKLLIKRYWNLSVFSGTLTAVENIYCKGAKHENQLTPYTIFDISHLPFTGSRAVRQ
jgi:hypothetical protein